MSKNTTPDSRTDRFKKLLTSNTLNKKTITYGILGVVLVVSLGVVSTFGFSISGLSAQPQASNPVTTQQIESIKKVKTLNLSTQVKTTDSVNFDAKVVNESEVRISAATQAVVKNVNFKRGSTVKKGDVLVTLGARSGLHPLQIAVSQAQTNLNNLDTGLNNLSNSNDNTVQRAELQIESTQTTVDDLQKTLDLTKSSSKITIDSAQQALKSLENDISRQEQTVKTNSDQVNATIDQQKASAKAFMEQNSTGLVNSLTSLSASLGGNYTQDINGQISVLNGFKTVDINNVQNRLQDFQAALNGLITFSQTVIQANTATPASVQTISVLSSTAAAYKAQAVSQIASLNSSGVNQQAGTIQNLNNLESLKSKRTDLQLALDKASNATQIQEQATKAQINSANKQLENTKLLLDSAKIGAKTQTDNSEGQKQLLRLQLQNAQSQLSALTITAPFDGIISDVKIVPNQDVSPGLELVTVYGTGNKFIRGNLKPQYLPNIKPDDIVELSLSGDDKTKGSAKVTIVYPVANSTTGLVPIDMELLDDQNPNLDSSVFVSGANIQAKLQYTSSEVNKAIFIPTTAISLENDTKFVWVVEKDKNTLTKKIITLGSNKSDQSEVLTGLSGDEIIVITDLSGLKEGQAVSI